jgi:hypothetical protein
MCSNLFIYNYIMIVISFHHIDFHRVVFRVSNFTLIISLIRSITRTSKEKIKNEIRYLFVSVLVVVSLRHEISL